MDSEQQTQIEQDVTMGVDEVTTLVMEDQSFYDITKIDESEAREDGAGVRTLRSAIHHQLFESQELLVRCQVIASYFPTLVCYHSNVIRSLTLSPLRRLLDGEDRSFSRDENIKKGY